MNKLKPGVLGKLGYVEQMQQEEIVWCALYRVGLERTPGPPDGPEGGQHAFVPPSSQTPCFFGRTLSFVSPLGKVLSLPSPLSGLYSLRRKGTTVVRVARVLKRDCFD